MSGNSAKKLNAGASAFVPSAKAAAFVPGGAAAAAAAAAPATPAKSADAPDAAAAAKAKKLNSAAKAFVPRFTAAAFVPSPAKKPSAAPAEEKQPVDKVAVADKPADEATPPAAAAGKAAAEKAVEEEKPKEEAKPATATATNTNTRASFSSKGGVTTEVTSEAGRARAASLAEEGETQAEKKLLDGIRVYNRKFLMQFKDMYTDKPKGLPDLEAIIGSGKVLTGPRRGEGGKKSGWRESKSNNNNNRRNNQHKGKRGRHNHHNNKNQKPLITGPVAPLEKTENAYSIKRDLDEEETTMRAFNGILNKLTPEKFDILLKRVYELKINNVHLLREVVKAVFEKALREPAFSPTYAQFCKKLSADLPTFTDEDTKETHSFKRLILNQCQQEFERGNASAAKAAADAAVAEAKAKAGDDSKPTPEAEAEAAQQVLDATKAKQRMLGTIRFIGELFVRGMLGANIMTHCLGHLLGDQKTNIEELNVEALCKLLTTVGKALEKVNRPYVDELFGSLHKIEEDRSNGLSMRIRFMIRDMYDLRDAQWVSRRQELKATKLSEVQKQEARQKAASAQAKKATQRAPRRETNRGIVADRHSRGRNSKKRGGGGGDAHTTTDNSGWTTTGTWKGGNQDVRGGASHSRGGKKKGSRGPNNSNNNNNKQKGGNGASKKDEEDAPAEPKGPVNAFAMLGDSDDDDDDDDDAEEEEEEEVAVREPEKRITPDQARSKIKSMLREYFNIVDLKEAVLCIEDLGTSKFNPMVVTETVFAAVEGKQKERDLVPKLFTHLHSHGVLERAHFEKGMDEVFEYAEDMIIDIPLYMDHVAPILSQLMLDQSLELTYLMSKACEAVRESGRLAKLACAVLKRMKEVKGENELDMVLMDTDLKFIKLMKKAERKPAAVKKLLKENGLDGLML